MSTPNPSRTTHPARQYHTSLRSPYTTPRTGPTTLARPATSTPSMGSATQTTTSTPTSASSSEDHLVLHLRGAHDPSISTNRSSAANPNRRSIRWAPDVIDNEGLGRKSSKVCCIYHKAREVGESSDESSDSDSEGSGSEGSESADDGAARMVGGNRRKGRGVKGHGHHNDEDCGHGKRKVSPNAYEKMKSYKPTKAERK